MRRIHFAAAVLMMLGAAVASFTIWQLIDNRATETELQGPAPVLIGDAPAPVTATSESGASTERASETPIDRNLGPATPPASTADRTQRATQTISPDGGAVNSASRTTKTQDAVPVSLRIPRLKIDPEIVPVGLNARGEMASPTSYSAVGWWQHGAVPGDFGRAVLAGHVDSPTARAIFYDLDKLELGDEIFVTREGGGSEELRFVVSGAALYHVDHAPIDQIFGPSTEQELVLITCGGTFDRGSGVYLYRRVVFAKLVNTPGSDGPRSSEN